ncbi:MAG: Ribonuclease P protein component [Holosporales bacterium]
MRLKKRAEFLNVQQKGQKIKKPAFTFCFVEQAFPVSRVGLTASKKVGNAVIRNRAKRRLRSLIFENMQEFLAQNRVDVVLIAHPQLPEYSYAHLTRDLKAAVKDATTRLSHG